MARGSSRAWHDALVRESAATTQRHTKSSPPKENRSTIKASGGNFVGRDQRRYE
jgi:hypothetical protein